MHRIQIDDEVHALLAKNAKPFVDTENTTLRRLLGLDAERSSPATAAGEPDLAEQLGVQIPPARQKAPKADLQVLVAKGLLKANERLHLVDFKRKKLGEVAIVAGKDLVHNGARYSMSALADELLAKVGYTAGSTRGPIHWATARGETINDLWSKVPKGG